MFYDFFAAITRRKTKGDSAGRERRINVLLGRLAAWFFSKGFFLKVFALKVGRPFSQSKGDNYFCCESWETVGFKFGIIRKPEGG